MCFKMLIEEMMFFLKKTNLWLKSLESIFPYINYLTSLLYYPHRENYYSNFYE